MAQVVPGVARFELKYRTPDDIVENVYYVQSSGGTWDETTLDDVAAAFVDWETTIASTDRGDAVALYEIIATDLTSLNGIRKAYGIQPPIAGTEVDTLPLNATVALKADIGRRGRGTSGRSFWVGLALEQLASADQLDATAGLDLIGAMNDLRDAIGAVTGVDGLCIPHFVVGGARPPSVDADIVTRYTLSDYFIDSQRDRLPFHKKRKLPPVA